MKLRLLPRTLHLLNRILAQIFKTKFIQNQSLVCLHRFLNKLLLFVIQFVVRHIDRVKILQTLKITKIIKIYQAY